MASKITVGKIVASATDSSWSQAYHAGGFTAVLSVSTSTPSPDHPLQTTGKELLDTLVAEYFTIPQKDLETVKNAVQTTIKKVPEGLHVGLIVAAVVKNILYVVIAKEGKVLLKRGEKVGMLLALTPESEEKIVSVSGFLETGDVVLLYTPQFGHVFSHDELETALMGKTAEELAESFAPKVHGAGDGGASALVFSFQEDDSPFVEKPKEEPARIATQSVAGGETEVIPPKPDEHALPGFESPLPQQKSKGFSFSHRQRLFLTVAVVLSLVLIGSIVVFQMRQKEAKLQQEFAAVYTPAKAKYDEAQGMMDVNKSLAIEDLSAAQQSLQNAKSQFPADSSQEKQLTTLLAQVTSSLDNAKKVPLIQAQKAPDNASPLLTFASSHTGMYVTQDTTNFYTADNNAITSYDKKTNASKKLVTNTSDWRQIGGFDTYFGNFYVLDTKDGIDKYVSGSGGFGKSSYFASGVNPDLSKAVSLSIDSSVYVLLSDGTIMKYTKGSPDTFNVTGVTTPLKNPTEILTSADLDNIYVLDTGNAQVVVLKKDGTFVAQYASDQLRSATAIDVSEKNKKIYFLSSGTVYQLDMK